MSGLPLQLQSLNLATAFMTLAHANTLEAGCILKPMRELLYSAANHYKTGKAAVDAGDTRAAMREYAEALRDLHAVKPQRMRDVLLAQVHLSRYQVALSADPKQALKDLRFGYSYARTTREASVQELAEKLWHEHLRQQGRDIETLAGND